MIADRYHAPDIVQIADGHRMDRDNLIEHTRPVRKNRPTARDRIAARSTLYVTNRKRDLAMEVYFFGEFTPDGRMRRGHMLTRTLPVTET
ncbi:hypothetical protein [Amycolatopsis keratiniphila]|uniref:hypothetical protein n=1 Tax=Amycolatopsis keratiniphila TaxID=129921 RepID=UPI001E35B766|nr:hypothetical protein [Amycolatopsis keratiniphila]